MRQHSIVRTLVLPALTLAILPLEAIPSGAQTARQARICRSLLPVLNPRDARLKVLSTQTVGPGDGVAISYDVSLPDVARTRNRRLVCAFAGRKTGSDELMLVSSDGRILGLPRLTFLKRFYLRSREADGADEKLQLPPAELQRQKLD